MIIFSEGYSNKNNISAINNCGWGVKLLKTDSDFTFFQVVYRDNNLNIVDTKEIYYIDNPIDESLNFTELQQDRYNFSSILFNLDANISWGKIIFGGNTLDTFIAIPTEGNFICVDGEILKTEGKVVDAFNLFDDTSDKVIARFYILANGKVFSKGAGTHNGIGTDVKEFTQIKDYRFKKLLGSNQMGLIGLDSRGKLWVFGKYDWLKTSRSYANFSDKKWGLIETKENITDFFLDRISKRLFVIGNSSAGYMLKTGDDNVDSTINKLVQKDPYGFLRFSDTLGNDIANISYIAPNHKDSVSFIYCDDNKLWVFGNASMLGMFNDEGVRDMCMLPYLLSDSASNPIVSFDPSGKGCPAVIKKTEAFDTPFVVWKSLKDYKFHIRGTLYSNDDLRYKDEADF